MKILVAGIGNIFLGDDAFGVAVAQRLLEREWPPEVRVADYGIRGLDLTYALMEDYDTVILVDAVPRGAAPGTLYVIEPDLDQIGEGSVTPLDGHNLSPVHVLHLIKALGVAQKRILIVGCEPQPLGEGEQLEGVLGMSTPVQGAIEEAIGIVESLVQKTLKEQADEAITRVEDRNGHRGNGVRDGVVAGH